MLLFKMSKLLFKLFLDIKKFVYLELLEKLLFFGALKLLFIGLELLFIGLKLPFGPLELLFIGLNLLFSPLELLLKLLI